MKKKCYPNIWNWNFNALTIFNISNSLLKSMKYISYDKLCIAFSLLKLPYIQHGSKFLQCTLYAEIKSSGRRKTSCTHVPKFVHVYIYSKQNRCWTNKQTKTMNLMEIYRSINDFSSGPHRILCPLQVHTTQ